MYDFYNTSHPNLDGIIHIYKLYTIINQTKERKKERKNKTHMEIINKILEWPVIIQGALGSLLFWLFFTLSQKTIQISTKKIKDDKDLGSYWGRSARDEFYKHQFEFSTYSFFICIYGAIHYFLKFIISIFVSFIIIDFIPVFGYVGYIIGLYFIFRSISYVTHFKVFENEDRKSGKKHPLDEKLKQE